MYCEKKGIIFLSTPFDLLSIDFLDSIGQKFWKIPSGEITNLPYLIKIAESSKRHNFIDRYGKYRGN